MAVNASTEWDTRRKKKDKSKQQGIKGIPSSKQLNKPDDEKRHTNKIKREEEEAARRHNDSNANRFVPHLFLPLCSFCCVVLSMKQPTVI